MKNLIIVSNGWGPKYGGINSFNYDICNSIKLLEMDEVNFKCVVPRSGVDIDSMSEAERDFLIIVSDASFEASHELALVIDERLVDCDESVWVGHDIKTGNIAYECAKLLEHRCAVIHHMDYSSYYTYMGKNALLQKDKNKQQEELFENVDIVLAVGPKLKKSAQDKLVNIYNEKVDVIQLIPGVAGIQPVTIIKNKFTGITFGRIEGKTEIIKQSKLALAGFSNAVKLDSNLSNSECSMTIMGLSKEDIVSEQEKLWKFSKEIAGKMINVNGLPYTESREELFKELREASVCFMLSLHEGFGLVGMEAISAGVPLLLTKNSGLYSFLKENLGIYGEHAITPIAVNGDYGDEFFDEDDCKQVTEAIIELKRDYERRKKYAINLREQLVIKGYTWENTAKTLLERVYSTPFADVKKLSRRKSFLVCFETSSYEFDSIGSYIKEMEQKLKELTGDPGLLCKGVEFGSLRILFLMKEDSYKKVHSTYLKGELHFNDFELRGLSVWNTYINEQIEQVSSIKPQLMFADNLEDTEIVKLKLLLDSKVIFKDVIKNQMIESQYIDDLRGRIHKHFSNVKVYVTTIGNQVYTSVYGLNYQTVRGGKVEYKNYGISGVVFEVPDDVDYISAELLKIYLLRDGIKIKGNLIKIEDKILWVFDNILDAGEYEVNVE